MNTVTESIFDADAQQLRFGSDAIAMSRKYVTSSDRELFYYLVNVDEYSDVLPVAQEKIAKQLAKKKQDIYFSFPFEDDVLHQIFINHEARNSALCELNKAQSIEIIRQYTPTALTNYCWLQNTSQAATCHTEIAASLFRLYAPTVRLKTKISSCYPDYRILLKQLTIDMPDVKDRAFSKQTCIFDLAFETPVLALCLAQFPRTFLAEIIGFTLAHSYSTPFILKLKSIADLEIFNAFNSNSNWCGDNASIQEQRNNIKKVVQCYMLSNIDRQPVEERWQRIISGFSFYLSTQNNFFERVLSEIRTQKTLHQQVILLFNRKSPFAYGHHRHIKIGGKNMDEWFSGDGSATGIFLKELTQSAYFDLQEPQNSHFFTHLTAFGGPMFGVFSDQELELILRWLQSLKDGYQQTVGCQHLNAHEKKKQKYSSCYKLAVSGQPFSINNHRELFYYLVNMDYYPSVLPAAKQLVSNYLKKTEKVASKKQFFPFNSFEYDYDLFEAYIKEIYLKEINAYQPFSGSPQLMKEVYIWAIEQFSPTILVDGCWLQGIAKAGDRHNEISRRLFDIYADEIGDGRIEQNHPNVYRALLQSLNIDLPEIHTQQFIQHSAFLNSAFDVPVYLLSISKFPKTFLPEILGLNLAIELSGLGSIYMRLVDELMYWDIDPSIISLHISIDNMENGHSAIAKDLIEVYLDHILTMGGYNDMQAHWKRIWTGYLSLRSVPSRFKRALIWTYLGRFVLPKMGRPFKKCFGMAN